MSCAAGTNVHNLWVEISSRSHRWRHSCTALELSSSCRALELSSSALAPPCCSLSLYYPTMIPLMHLPLELHSQAGAYSSNHWLLTHTSAHTYWVLPETHTLGTHRKKCAIQWRICFPTGYLHDCQNGQLDDGKCSVMCTPSAADIRTMLPRRPGWHVKLTN
jgi:hypothetical protein